MLCPTNFNVMSDKFYYVRQILLLYPTNVHYISSIRKQLVQRSKQKRINNNNNNNNDTRLEMKKKQNTRLGFE